MKKTKKTKESTAPKKKKVEKKYSLVISVNGKDIEVECDDIVKAVVENMPEVVKTNMMVKATGDDYSDIVVIPVPRAKLMKINRFVALSALKRLTVRL